MDLSAIKRTNQSKKADLITPTALSQVTMATGPSPNPPMPASSGALTTAPTTSTPSAAVLPTKSQQWLTYALFAGAVWYFFLRKSR